MCVCLRAQTGKVFGLCECVLPTVRRPLWRARVCPHRCGFAALLRERCGAHRGLTARVYADTCRETGGGVGGDGGGGGGWLVSYKPIAGRVRPARPARTTERVVVHAAFGSITRIKIVQSTGQYCSFCGGMLLATRPIRRHFVSSRAPSL